jgi:hypothetical protein
MGPWSIPAISIPLSSRERFALRPEVFQERDIASWTTPGDDEVYPCDVRGIATAAVSG